MQPPDAKPLRGRLTPNVLFIGVIVVLIFVCLLVFG